MNPSLAAVARPAKKRKKTPRRPRDTPIDIPPLPTGVQHCIRITQSLPDGYVMYRLECPKHGKVPAFSAARLPDVFLKHSQCRCAPAKHVDWWEMGYKGCRSLCIGF